MQNYEINSLSPKIEEVFYLLCVVINPGNTWKLLKEWHTSDIVINFATKTEMDRERIEMILGNASEEYLEHFFENLLNEINNDDEPYFKKARQLLLASLNNEHADDFFIAISGWSLETLFDQCD